MQITIINGPNLNLLGKREPEIYGGESFEAYVDKLQSVFPEIQFIYVQSNIEGELVTAIQQHGFTADGIILNPAAYTHTSVAIGDAVAAIQSPVVEVHISNVHRREEFRHLSYVSGVVDGSIIGLGLDGYELAVRWLINHAK